MNWKTVLLAITIAILVISGMINVNSILMLGVKDSEITNLNVQINSKTSEINDLQVQVAQKISEVDSLNSEVNSLNSQVVNLTLQIDNLQNDVTYGDTEIIRLNNIIENLKAEAVQRDSEMFNRDEQIRNLESQVSSLNYQINDLNNELDALKSPKLVNVGLGAHDNRENTSEPFLQIEGSVFNVGRETAYNCKLRVVAYQGDVQSIFVLDADSGTIEGLASVTFNTKVYYSGGPMSMSLLTMTPEWTDTP